MADLEKQIDKVQGAFKARLKSRARAFSHPDDLLRQAIAYVRQAQQTKKPVSITSYGKTATLKYNARRTFVLLMGQRSRWGTGAQIAEDVRYFLEFGAMPPSSGQSWA